MKKKRTQDLFRFVTLRTPELIDQDRKQLGFVKHPDSASSTFLVRINENDLGASRLALIDETSSFLPYVKVEEIKDLSINLWEFSLWLGKNKNNLVRSELDVLIPTSLPTSAEIITLWDNFYFDVLTETNPYIRQACLQLIVTLNFIENYATYSPGTTIVEEEQIQESLLLKRLANGKVLIHEAFTTSKNPLATFNPYGQFNSRRLEARHKAMLSCLDIPELEKIQNSLKEVDNQYELDYSIKYNTALSTYQAEVKVIVDNYLNGARKNQIIERTESSFPEELIPVFDFHLAPPLSLEYASEFLTEEARLYVHKNRLQNSPVSDALARINEDISYTRKASSKLMRRKYSSMLINGSVVRPNASSSREFALSFKEVETSLDERSMGMRYAVYFTLDVGSDKSFFTSHKFTFTIGESTFTSSCPKVLCQSNGLIFVQLFPETSLLLPPCSTYTFEATMNLSDGTRSRIDFVGSTSIFITSGIAIAITDPNAPSIHHGVNRIGVADFRRVEQELCCYVAGEVSHIENILAKEYKEKSTRQLTRTENTIEITNEREVEELTDTTTTTRHEMNSEIAEVLKKDRESNLGFDVGVNGQYPSGEYNASAYGDFSFGQSTSDSNTIARKFAEEVTKRALERIVQKTTSRRTSKIIKEFEENNKHGFDNREGESHVTGVYRWVDKVYKNRIVNYGKRLMYEFMIPEPSRFYKEAIIIQAEEDGNSGTTDIGSPQNTSVIVKPDPLTVHGIASSSDITRDNYESISAIYGANPDSPLAEFVNLSPAYSESPGTTDDSLSFPHNDTQVPTNYQCYEIYGLVSYSWKANWVPAYAYIKVTTMTTTWEKTGLSGQSDSTRSFTHVMPNIEGAISIVIATQKMKSFNLALTVKCKLSATVFQQWQQDTYNSIQSAYETKLQAYNDAQAIAEANAQADAEATEEESAVRSNAGFNAEIIKTELKRLCIEMITRPFGIEQGKDFYQNGACDVPILKLGADLDIYSSRIKFFEQAFDWDIMSQQFYPYYWAKKCDWKSLYQTQDANDHIFQAFLQSGMGRVIVPIKEGFEDAVTFFMETGRIWNGTGIVIDTDDELYVSIVDEMTKVEGLVEGEEWETIIPSSLTVVQARSVLLDEEGLPCCDNETAEDTNNLLASTETLQIIPPSTNPA